MLGFVEKAAVRKIQNFVQVLCHGKWLGIALLGFGLAGAAVAQTASSGGDAPDAQIRKRWEARFPGMPKPDQIRRTPFANVYEVNFGPELFYTDDKVSFVFDGQLIDAQTQKNLTQQRIEQLTAVKFADLPLELAVKTVKGDGSRKIAIFEDPNCGYCRQFTQILQGVNNITVYSFLYPVLSPESVRLAKTIWCADDRAKAWNDWMLSSKQPAEKRCADPTDKVLALGEKLRVRGTPTIIFTDGTRVPGAMPAPALKTKLDSLNALTP